MLTAPLAIGLLAASTIIAVAVAGVAMMRNRAMRAALQGSVAAAGARAEFAGQAESHRRLAGDVAHHLTDMLTSITGHTELLIAGLDPSGGSMEDALQIRQAARTAANLLKPFRALSGGRRASIEVVDVNAVIAHTAGSMTRMLGPAIEVVLPLAGRIERIRIGAGQLEEIVLNLGVHARGAMPNGGRLTVATAMHTDEAVGVPGGARREYVRMTVSDSGGGLSADAHSTLFEPFLSSDEAAVNAAGLAKVNAIVHDAGGRIDVASAAGVGTTFTIDFPAASESDSAMTAASTPTSLPTSVLVVEDEPRVRELIRLVLVRAGHDVVAVAGPRAALAALARQPATSLMLVDLVMPEMDGYDLAAASRKIVPGVRIMFLSGFAPDAARHPSGDPFLAKPFTVESLIAMVQETLAKN
jgi:two-component system cell cycle sensor histidine kinase/response regulator CckA